MRHIATLACLLALLSALPARASTLKDVFGREVPLGQGRPAVVFYANLDTRETLREHAFQFVLSLREQRPIIVIRVDLRGIPGLFEGLARREMRKSHHASLAAMRTLFTREDEEPPADLEDSLFMVADSDGAPHRALGLNKGFSETLALALSPSGGELARAPFPSAADTIRRALESLTVAAVTGPAPQP